MSKYQQYLAFLLIFLAGTLSLNAQARLPRSTPEEQGVASENVIKYLDAVNSLPKGSECHSSMVLRHGHVIGEAYPIPFNADYSHTLYSCSKTFVAAAIGIAEKLDLLSISDPIAYYFHNELPKDVSPNLADITIGDLLKMASGIKPDWELRNRTDKWIAAYLSQAVEGQGEKFQYDSMATYLLSAVLQRATGKTTLDFLKINLFRPMEIREAEWELSPEGINTGGWGLKLKPESLAKFGQLLLDGGRWNGEQLVPRRWVEEMMTPHIATGGDMYGYQMWKCGDYNAWRADGAFGQYIVIIPEADMVVVMTQCIDMDAKRDRAPIWEYLTSNLSDTPLPASAESERLAHRQKAYFHPTPAGTRTNARQAASLNGKRIRFGNSGLEFKEMTVTVEKNGDLKLSTLNSAGERYNIYCGYQRWLTTKMHAEPPYSIKARGRFSGLRKEFQVSGSYAWEPDGTLAIHVFYPSWISGVEFKLAPDHKSVHIKENTQSKGYRLPVTVR